MRQSFQRGYLRCTRRKSGPACWECLWREYSTSGKPVRRTIVVGTTDQYKTRDCAIAAINGLRMQVNAERHRSLGYSISVSDLIDHYIERELSATAPWHSHATRVTHLYVLNNWLRPYWGTLDIHAVRTVEIEHWLREQKRLDGTTLANSSKAKIRSVLSVLFNHAIRYEWLEQGRNPALYVRQSAKRRRAPDILEPKELHALLAQLESCFRLMVLVAGTTGLRRSELFALKWGDIDFSNLRIDIRRSIFSGIVGECKTEASRQPIPVDERVAADLWLWKETSKYSQPADWVFASPRTQGRLPFWPDIVMQKVIKPAAARAGIRKNLGWHSLRHSYSSLLIANGENVKVVQELMRHASSRFTLDVYSQAHMAAKYQAQRRLVQMILEEETESAVSLRKADVHSAFD
jgi:integrase